jgi:hypothetical protein
MTKAKTAKTAQSPAAPVDESKATVATGPDATDPAQVGAMSGTSTGPDGTVHPVGPTIGQPQVGPDDLQAQAAAPRVATVIGNRQYSTGEGFEAGQTATKNLWLDTETNKVVESPPERGKVLAIKGDLVQPYAAEQIAYYQSIS